MNIYEMLKEHLPKERKPDWCNAHYNQGINAVFDVLKRAKIDERQLSIILVDVFGRSIGHIHPDNFFNKLNKTNILRIEDEKTKTKS